MLFAALIILCTLFLYGAVYFKYRPSPPPPKNQYNLSDRREIRCSSGRGGRASLLGGDYR